MILLPTKENSGMNGSDVFLDTNAIIAIFEGHKTLISFLEGYDLKLHTSFICQIEVLAYDKLTEDEEEVFNEFFSTKIKVHDQDEFVRHNTIHLRRIYKKLRLPDAIIAGTAIVYQYPLISSDPHFEMINYPGFQLIPFNPKQ